MRFTDDRKYEILVVSRCPYCSTGVYLARDVDGSPGRAFLLHPTLNEEGNTCEDFNTALHDAKKLLTDVLRCASQDELKRFALTNLDRTLN